MSDQIQDFKEQWEEELYLELAWVTRSPRTLASIWTECASSRVRLTILQNEACPESVLRSEPKTGEEAFWMMSGLYEKDLELENDCE